MAEPITVTFALCCPQCVYPVLFSRKNRVGSTVLRCSKCAAVFDNGAATLAGARRFVKATPPQCVVKPKVCNRRSKRS